MILIFWQLEKYQNEYYPDNLNLLSIPNHTSLQFLMLLISVLERSL